MVKDKTMMRIDGNLLKDLEMIKLCKRESYANVVKRMIDKEKMLARKK
jgi:hypothetical protein